MDIIIRLVVFGEIFNIILGQIQNLPRTYASVANLAYNILLSSVLHDKLIL